MNAFILLWFAVPFDAFYKWEAKTEGGLYNENLPFPSLTGSTAII